MTLWKLTLASLLLSGCFPHPSENYACETSSTCEEGRVCEDSFCVFKGTTDDAGSNDATGELCAGFSSRHFDTCTLPTPTEQMNLTGGEYKYNTATGELTDPGNNVTMPTHVIKDGYQVISVLGFSLASGATLRVTGANPLIIASFTSIDVAGTIDVSSTPTIIGAGANPTTCAARAVATPGKQGDGGGGGGNASAGAAGGFAGEQNPNGTGGGGTGGAALTAAPLLAGGCSGSAGSKTAGNGTVGAAGPGGGAVQLTAKGSININPSGKINAGGAGGTQGLQGNNGQYGGGGGGGAGGMIGLEATDLVVSSGAILAANGGGGGQGGGDTNGNAGQNGQLAITEATGGTTGTGGNGGTGSVVGTAPVARNAGAEDGAGGGGGGGGAGWITVKGTRADTGAIYSPPPTVIP